MGLTTATMTTTALLLMLAMSYASCHTMFPSGSEGSAPGDMQLGSVDFPVSTTQPLAQSNFELGVKLMHAFWFDLAGEKFRQAIYWDPYLAIAYAMEALSHRHFLWQYEDLAGAQTTLAKMEEFLSPELYGKLTLKERFFIDAVRGVFAHNVDQTARDARFLGILQEALAAMPEDIDVRTFVALAYIGGSTHYKSPTSDEMQHSAQQLLNSTFPIAEKVGLSDHPGLFHYTLHAFDRPELGVPDQALRVALNRPANIINSSHLQHMPSHIFVRLGMWNQSAIVNQRSAAEGDAFCASITKNHRDYLLCDKDNRYHALEWLTFSLLQMNRMDEYHQRLADLYEAVEYLKDTFVDSTYRRIQGYHTAQEYLLQTHPNMTFNESDWIETYPLTDDYDIFWLSYTEGLYTSTLGFRCVSSDGPSTELCDPCSEQPLNKFFERLQKAADQSVKFPFIHQSAVIFAHMLNLTILHNRITRCPLDRNAPNHIADVAAQFNELMNVSLTLNDKLDFIADNPSLPAVVVPEMLAVTIARLVISNCSPDADPAEHLYPWCVERQSWLERAEHLLSQALVFAHNRPTSIQWLKTVRSLQQQR